MECIRKLVEVDQDWVPYSLDASLYIRPTYIGIEVSTAPPLTDTGDRLHGFIFHIGGGGR